MIQELERERGVGIHTMELKAAVEVVELVKREVERDP